MFVDEPNDIFVGLAQRIGSYKIPLLELEKQRNAPRTSTRANKKRPTLPNSSTEWNPTQPSPPARQAELSPTRSDRASRRSATPSSKRGRSCWNAPYTLPRLCRRRREGFSGCQTGDLRKEVSALATKKGAKKKKR
jgi:hypothetical protein